MSKRLKYLSLLLCSNNNNFLRKQIDELTTLITNMKETSSQIEKTLNKEEKNNNYCYEDAIILSDTLFKKLKDLKTSVDTLEEMVDKSFWPFKTYADMLIKR